MGNRSYFLKLIQHGFVSTLVGLFIFGFANGTEEKPASSPSLFRCFEISFGEETGLNALESNSIQDAMSTVLSFRSDGTVRELKDRFGNIYYVTDRELDSLYKSYMHGELNSQRLARKRVLDAGCGGGSLVQSLRTENVEAFGVDIHLSKEQSRFSYFKQAEMQKTGYPGEYFDEIFSHASVFSYPSSFKLKIAALSELTRVVKVGGSLHLAWIKEPLLIENVIRSIPNLRIQGLYRAEKGMTINLIRTY